MSKKLCAIFTQPCCNYELFMLPKLYNQKKGKRQLCSYYVKQIKSSNVFFTKRDFVPSQQA